MLFESYLNDRKQFVQLGSTKSSLGCISCGVPQGSILGPLLFLIYVNDMSRAISTGMIRLFADDTCIIYKGKDIKSIAKVVNDELVLLSNWFKVNVLAINVKESNFMIIKNSRKKLKDDIRINFDEKCLEQCKKCKYLGVIIDDCLNWKEHVRKVCNISNNRFIIKN